jgi:hypothetical protein
MNIRTKIVSFVIILFTVITIFLSIAGTFLPSSVDANYIRQSAAQRSVQGGGINFGK